MLLIFDLLGSGKNLLPGGVGKMDSYCDIGLKRAVLKMRMVLLALWS